MGLFPSKKMHLETGEMAGEASTLGKKLHLTYSDVYI